MCGVVAHRSCPNGNGQWVHSLVPLLLLHFLPVGSVKPPHLKSQLHHKTYFCFLLSCTFPEILLCWLLLTDLHFKRVTITWPLLLCQEYKGSLAYIFPDHWYSNDIVGTSSIKCPNVSCKVEAEHVAKNVLILYSQVLGKLSCSFFQED